ncbi:D-2-hydroxyglutarate dehydrogenase, mitochondrial-like [Dendronephthya gigantea]|uniref:D-2-hydroxyglutarate dehydrogenase, mitochondrial-like n=1 Tax=Dendronephthya gigantea TaxID=151771 RepID=UPI00106B43AA|nr:D-2-hydroxyglutarate dehydrogenase, mitochondrial-like [Dendronephthya gigantea]
MAIMLNGAQALCRISLRSLPVFFKKSSRSFSSEPPLTSKRYPDLKRGDYCEITNDDLAKFMSILGAHRVIQDDEEIAHCNTDWMKTLRGASKVLLKPKTTQEVSEILAYCNSRKIAVVPQSGNTGLVGGSTPVFDEVILSLGLMNQIISMDDVSGILTCQAGCILEKLDNFLFEKGFIMPLDLGAKGSCMIGGNIATNAGGLRLLRYGSLHGTVLGLEAVLPNGQIVDNLSTCRKDNTGYHLKHMFIGSEGTLGVITAASIMVPYLPSSINVALLGCRSFQDLLLIFKAAKSMLGEVLSAFEMMDSLSIKASEVTGIQNPIQENQFYALIETSGSDSAHDEEKLTKFMEFLMNNDLVQDGTIATDKQKMTSIWAIRENITLGLNKMGYTYKYDISLPVVGLYDIVKDLRNKIGDQVITIVGYGHIGDGNLHLNIIGKEFDANINQILETFIFERVRSCQGSISAEHGIGFKKTKYLHYSKSNECIEMMKALKKMFDPHGILNPYKVLYNN